MLTLVKSGDDVREIRPGMGGNEGHGTLRMIGGMPLRRVRGPVIRLAGPVIAGEYVVAVVIEPVSGDWFGSRMITESGTEYPAVPSVRPGIGQMEDIRDAWIRYAVRSGIYAGIARMR